MALPDRWFRTTPDSSALPRPRLLARTLIELAELDECVTFYEWLLGTPADLRMPIPDFGGLELAAVGNLLLIASERPFTPIQRATAYSLIVPTLTGELETLHRAGGVVLEPVEAILPGSRARVRYPDGAIAELVEHRPQPGERPAPRADRPPVDTGVRLFARQAVPLAGFEAARQLYETVLDSPTRFRITPPSPAGCELALIDDLLLVGTDDPELAREKNAFALLVPSAHDARVLEVLDPALPRHECRATANLAGGVVAEVWNWELDA